MLHDVAEVAVGAVVEADLDEVEVIDCTDLLKEDANAVGAADVHLIMEHAEVVIEVNCVEDVIMGDEVAAVVGGSCSIPHFCSRLCEKSEGFFTTRIP
jgi:hypothetical protein